MDRRTLLASLAAAASAALAEAGCSRPSDPNAVHLGGPFRLEDTHGRPFTQADLKGTPYAMFFGFTYCPEVCPTTLTALSADLKALGPDADKLKVVFVSVDPERDTPSQMRQYLSMFDPRIVGLTGTPAQVAQIAKEYAVYYKKVPLPGGSYTMDHTAGVYLMRADGTFVTLMSYQTPPAEAAKELRALVHA